MWSQYISSESQAASKGRRKAETESTSEHLKQTFTEIKEIIQVQRTELSEIKRTNQSRLDGSKSKELSVAEAIILASEMSNYNSQIAPAVPITSHLTSLETPPRSTRSHVARSSKTEAKLPASEEIHQLSERCDLLTNHSFELQSKLVQSEERYQSLFLRYQEILQTNQQLQEQVTQFERRDSTQSLERLKANEDLKKAMMQIEKGQIQSKELAAKLLSLTTERDQLDSNVTELSEQISALESNLEASVEEKNGLGRENAALSEEIESLRLDLENKANGERSLGSEKAMLLDQIHNLEAELLSLTTERDQLDSNVTELSEQISALESNLEASVEEKNGLGRENAALSEEIESLRLDLENKANGERSLGSEKAMLSDQMCLEQSESTSDSSQVTVLLSAQHSLLKELDGCKFTCRWIRIRSRLWTLFYVSVIWILLLSLIYQTSLDLRLCYPDHTYFTS